MKFGMLTQIGPLQGTDHYMAAVVIFKNHTNPDITTRNRQIFAKFGMIVQNVSLKIVKKLNFENPRWRTAAIVKTVNLRNRLTDFEEICHGGAHWSRT